jgi:hypothetical protein
MRAAVLGGGLLLVIVVMAPFLFGGVHNDASIPFIISTCAIGLIALASSGLRKRK